MNYTPRRGWFHSWLDLDLGQVREDLAAIASLGCDHVRIFPLWPLLQPNRSLIRPRAVADVVAVVDAAHEAGLSTWVDVLNGHLSSFDFLPSWVSAWHRRNLYTDPAVVAGQAELVATLARALRDRPGAAGLGIGNEFIQFGAPRHPFGHALTPDDAEAWLTTLLGTAREQWPAGTHTHSYDDDLFFDPEHPFTPAHAVTLGDLTTVHSWVFGHVGHAHGPGHPVLPQFARYLVELAEAYSPDPTRSIWLQEVGAPVTHVAVEAAAEFASATMAALAGQPRLWGVTWWCSHDVDRELVDFPELEYSLGLFDSDGRVKPVGEAIAAAIAGWSDAPAAPRRALVAPTTTAAPDRLATRPDGELFAAWWADGTRPALVCSDRVNDADHLRERGIGEQIQPAAVGSAAAPTGDGRAA